MPDIKDDHNDDVLDEELDEEEVETGTSEDENLDDDDDSQDDDDDDNQDDDDDGSDDENGKVKFEKAFENIKGDTPEDYAKNLEEAYRRSSEEGKKVPQLKKQMDEMQTRIDQITAAVAKDPALAKAIEDATPEGAIPPTTDPALLYARNQLSSQMDKEYNDFVGAHPELESDPKIQEDVLSTMKDFGEQARARGTILPMKDALEKAWVFLGYDKSDDKEKLAATAKNNASKPKTNNSNKKRVAKPQLTPEQIAVGKKMGVTEEQMLASLQK